MQTTTGIMHALVVSIVTFFSPTKCDKCIIKTHPLPAHPPDCNQRRLHIDYLATAKCSVIKRRKRSRVACNVGWWERKGGGAALDYASAKCRRSIESSLGVINNSRRKPDLLFFLSLPLSLSLSLTASVSVIVSVSASASSGVVVVVVARITHDCF